jgi:hypothetical protein
VDKTLQIVQSKHDFFPQYEGITVGRANKNKALDPTGACASVCKSLSLVIASVQHHEKEMSRLNVTKDFWKPLGRQLVGVILSHIRRAKISGHGGRRLLRDLDEYFSTMVPMNVVETLDMIHCIQEVAGVYLVPPDLVTKFVVDNLRHLDANIVMALVRARADFGTPAAAAWTRELG